MKTPFIKMLSVSLIVTILTWIVSVAPFAKKTGMPKPGFDYKKMESNVIRGSDAVSKGEY